jgi:hypothetical protein
MIWNFRMMMDNVRRHGLLYAKAIPMRKTGVLHTKGFHSLHVL